jgi:uncharacterized protein (DUF1810 family)
VASPDPFHLQRFIDAQDGVFNQALSEIRAGRKQSHWMWFVFPQLAGLGRSATAQYFGIRSYEEAQAYLEHPILEPRLTQATEAAWAWSDRRTAEEIFGSVDAMKLRSCLTLFSEVALTDLFDRALQAFFRAPDEHTLALLQQSR